MIMRSIRVIIGTSSREAIRCYNHKLFPLVVISLLVIMCWILMRERDWVPSFNSGPHGEEDIFLSRNILLQDVCHMYYNQVKKTTGQLLSNTTKAVLQGNLTNYQMNHMYVDVDHRIMYCYVPKVGCTNWKRIIMMLTGRSNATDPLNIPSEYAHQYYNFRSLSQFKKNEQAPILKNYKKFIMVRHPMERLLSAYRNKFESSKGSAEMFHKQYGRVIIKAFRPNATIESLVRGHDVTFLEFVQYLLNPTMSLSFNKKESWNEHWEPMNGICNPCTVSYDYIGHFENLVEESNMILDKINPGGGVAYPESKYITTADTRNQMNKYYEQLPFQLINEIRKIYDVDMHLFNYTTKDMLYLN